MQGMRDGEMEFRRQSVTHNIVVAKKKCKSPLILSHRNDEKNL